ncbi:MAG: hypothetical protein ACQEUT_01630 [Bacillota bacterium]
MSKEIKIGITGHRKILESSIDQIEEELDRFFKEIKAEHQDKKWILQTPLAEGADRMAARIAVKNDFALHVLLPFEKEEYMKDFTTSESLAQFEELCQTAVSLLVPKLSSFSIEKRDDGYLRVGSYLAQTSDVLLALWDGRKDLELPGGTAHIIRMQMEGFPEYLQTDEVVSSRKTYVIPAPRTEEQADGMIMGDYLSVKDYINR